MASLPEPVTERHVSTAGALVRYCATAIGVRMVDAGAGVGLLLVAAHRFDAPGVAARTGGLLVALFTLPHLAGPLLARRLDLARDYRRVLGAAYGLVAVLLAVAVLALGRLPSPLVALLVLLAGLGGPMLTGGLSSRLAGLVPADETAQRRAQGLDATVYGVAATAGGGRRPQRVVVAAGGGAHPLRARPGVRRRGAAAARGGAGRPGGGAARPRRAAAGGARPAAAARQLRDDGDGGRPGGTGPRRRPARRAVPGRAQHGRGAAGGVGRGEPRGLAGAERPPAHR